MKFKIFLNNVDINELYNYVIGRTFGDGLSLDRFKQYIESYKYYMKKHSSSVGDLIYTYRTNDFAILSVVIDYWENILEK